MISLLKCTSKIDTFVIIILGGVASLWANCILITNLKNKMRSEYYILHGYDEYSNITWTIQLTYLSIFIIANGTLLWAFKKSLKSLLVPWSLLKLCENIILVVGSVPLYSKWSFYGLIPLSIISFAINVYISLSVYKAYKKIKLGELLKEYENDLKGVVQDGICEKSDKAIQTETTNFVIEIKKTSVNDEIKNNKDNPFNYIHTHIPNTS